MTNHRDDDYDAVPLRPVTDDEIEALLNPDDSPNLPDGDTSWSDRNGA